MSTYCLLKDGRQMVVWSDNTDEKTMHVYPIEDLSNFDASHQYFTKVDYSDIVRTDTNVVVAYA